jgi:hypothetical protein
MADTYKGMVFGNNGVFQMALQGGARRYALSNIFILGVLFGISNFIGTLQTTPELPVDGKFVIITPLIFSTFGVITMCGALIAFTLIYWAASRAFGGYGGFGLIFDLIGVAAVPFWILAPLLNYTIRYSANGPMRIILISAIIMSFLWSFRVIKESMVTGQGISSVKATIAVAAMWIFSISAIYVFMP